MIRVVPTTFDTDEHLLDAVRAGAAGFLLKDTSPEGLRAAVRVAAGGDALLSPSVTRRVMRAAAASPAPPATDLPALLTPREREVPAEVGAGLSNAEIGARLVISAATARTSGGCWPSSARGTARSSPSSPTRRAWCRWGSALSGGGAGSGRRSARRRRPP